MWHSKIDLHTHRRQDQRPAAGSRNDAQRRIISAQSDKILEKSWSSRDEYPS